jgi:hypothetical protein
MSGPASGRSRPAGEGLAGQRVDRFQQAVDLLIGVRGGQLDPESNLIVGDQRVSGERDVYALTPEQVGDNTELVAGRERQLDDGRTGPVRRLQAHGPDVVEHTCRVGIQRVPQGLAAACVHVETGEDSGQGRRR